MANEIYVDTSGFYALLVKNDNKHAAARRILQESVAHRRRFLTTDHVLAETANLLKARNQAHVLKSLFAILEDSVVCRTEWTDETRFAKVRMFFLKHSDQAWSFTDCVSFVVMKEFGLQEALAKDAHFEQAGFKALLQ